MFGSGPAGDGLSAAGWAGRSRSRERGSAAGGGFRLRNDPGGRAFDFNLSLVEEHQIGGQGGRDLGVEQHIAAFLLERLLSRRFVQRLARRGGPEKMRVP